MDDEITRIMIVSQYTLFREGLRRLLADAPGVELVGAVASLMEAEMMAGETPPDVIVVSRDEREQSFLSRLLDLAQVQVVAMTLENREADIYSRQGVTLNSTEDLLKSWQNV